MTVTKPPIWAAISAVLLPIAGSPIFFAAGEGAQGGYYFGVLLGSFFGITITLFLLGKPRK